MREFPPLKDGNGLVVSTEVSPNFSRVTFDTNKIPNKDSSYYYKGSLQFFKTRGQNCSSEELLQQKLNYLNNKYKK